MAKTMTLGLVVLWSVMVSHGEETLGYYKRGDKASEDELIAEHHQNPSCFLFADKNDPTSVQAAIFTQKGDGVFMLWNRMKVCYLEGMVWSNSECGCIKSNEASLSDRSISTENPLKCYYLVNVGYNEQSKSYEDKNKRFISNGHSDNPADLRAATITGVKGTSSKAALRFNGSNHLGVEQFRSNDLQGTWMCEIRLRPDPSASQMIAVTNDCGSSVQQQEVSIELAVSGPVIELKLRFTNDSKIITCQLRGDADGWLAIKMESLDTVVTVTVNGQMCGTVSPGTPVSTVNCRLYIGGSPVNPKKAFMGEIDYFRCKKNHHSCVDNN